MSNRKRVEELFEQVLNIAPHARAAYIAASGADLEVHKEVESLVGFHPAARYHLDTPFVPAEALVQTVVALNSPGETIPDPEFIGPYRILGKLGEGGMGTVYLAEQEQPLRRRVAVKLIKLGMDTRSVIARFEAERQALALMDHPHVARHRSPEVPSMSR